MEQLKKCSECGQEKSISNFYTDNRHSDGLKSECKNCCKERNQSSRLLYHYNMMIGQYELKLKEQGGVCKICGQLETVKTIKNGTIRSLAVDHNEITCKNRGLLCQRCNTALGKFNHNPELLRKAANYIEEYQ